MLNIRPPHGWAKPTPSDYNRDMHSSHQQNMRLPLSRTGSLVVKLVLLLATVGAAAYGGMALLRFNPKTRGVDEAIFFDIPRRDFELAITERGEIESAGDAEVRSQVKTKNQPGLSILRIVPEGTQVEKDGFLVELDSSALREEQTLQKIAVNTVEALVVEARNLYETAVISKREYLEGTFVQEKETLESELFVAEENLSRAREYLNYSKKLAEKGYVNDLQLKADAFAVEKANKEADAAKTKLRVLEEFTRAKMLKQFESDILITKAKWEAEKNSLQLEVDKLNEINEQISKCTITAPRAGTVKYAHVRDRRGSDDFVVEEGALVRERQIIIRLPDVSQMRVEMKINESLIQHVKVGMPATIDPIGSGGESFQGSVEHVNQYAEPSGWRKANVKEYKAQVRIDDDAAALRSGMTASVTIRSKFEPDVIQAPVQAVYAHGDQYYCFVRRGERLEPQPVSCGPTNDRFFVIESGLEESDQVAMNPRALTRFVSLPELPPEQEQAIAGRTKPRDQENKVPTSGKQAEQQTVKQPADSNPAQEDPAQQDSKPGKAATPTVAVTREDSDDEAGG